MLRFVNRIIYLLEEGEQVVIYLFSLFYLF